MRPFITPKTLFLAVLARVALAAPQLKSFGVTSSSAAAADQTFDYIVVGAGLAGTTVAARLAENPAITVLLVEAGADNRNDPRVYDIYNYGQAFGSDLDWNWRADRGRSIAGYLSHRFFPVVSIIHLRFQWQNVRRQLIDQRCCVH